MWCGMVQQSENVDYTRWKGRFGECSSTYNIDQQTGKREHAWILNGTQSLEMNSV